MCELVYGVPDMRTIWVGIGVQDTGLFAGTVIAAGDGNAALSPSANVSKEQADHEEDPD